MQQWWPDKPNTHIGLAVQICLDTTVNILSPTVENVGALQNLLFHPCVLTCPSRHAASGHARLVRTRTQKNQSTPCRQSLCGLRPCSAQHRQLANVEQLRRICLMDCRPIDGLSPRISPGVFAEHAPRVYQVVASKRLVHH